MLSDKLGGLALPDITDEFKSALVGLFPGVERVSAVIVQPSGGDAAGVATAAVRDVEARGDTADIIIVISRYRERGRVS